MNIKQNSKDIVFVLIQINLSTWKWLQQVKKKQKFEFFYLQIT
jgi:hypothetical protein